MDTDSSGDGQREGAAGRVEGGEVGGNGDICNSVYNKNKDKQKAMDKQLRGSRVGGRDRHFISRGQQRSQRG